MSILSVNTDLISYGWIFYLMDTLMKLSPLFIMGSPQSLCSNERQDLMDDGVAAVRVYCSAGVCESITCNSYLYKAFVELCVVVVVVIEEEKYLRVICVFLLATERPPWPATTNLLVLERGSRGPSTVTLIALA